jgi:hypothetical protein
MNVLWRATPHPQEQTAVVVRDQSGKTVLVVGDASFHAGEFGLRQLEVLVATDKERQALLDAGFHIKGLRA